MYKVSSFIMPVKFILMLFQFLLIIFVLATRVSVSSFLSSSLNQISLGRVYLPRNSFQVWQPQLSPVQASRRLYSSGKPYLLTSDLCGIFDPNIWRVLALQPSERLPDRAPLHRLLWHNLADP
jgi:hypothetical protein